MTTPTDPYNGANRRPFDDEDEVLAPIENTRYPQDEANTADTQALSYGSAEALAWEKVFTAESAAVAGEPETLPEATNHDTAENSKNDTHNTAFTGENKETSTNTDSVNAEQILNTPTPSRENGLHPSENTPSIINSGIAPTATQPTSDTSESLAPETFNTLPAHQRTNANLKDVLSAHSADEASLSDAAEGAQIFPDYTPGNAPDSASASTTDNVAPDTGNTGTASENTQNPALSGGFMQPVASADEEAQRRAKWEQGPSAYANENLDLEPPSPRGWTHAGIFFLTLLLIPIVWYLLSDASIRLNMVENNPWDSKILSFAAIFELLTGLIALLILILLARVSSLGAQFFGLLLTLCGVYALLIPTTVQSLLAKLDAVFGNINDFTHNVVHHLDADFGSGRIAIFGIMLLASGITAHFARRSGAERATIYERRKALGLDS